MEIKLTGKKIFWGIVIILIVAGAVAWTWESVAAAQNPNGPSQYSAVYLASGDIYFGKLSWFPEPHMTDVWYLNRVTGANGKTQLSVAPFKNAFWGPTNEITLNPKQILFWTRLSNSSQLVKALNHPSSIPQQSAQGATSTAAGSASASTNQPIQPVSNPTTGASSNSTGGTHTSG